jgi:hypothetical protein
MHFLFQSLSQLRAIFANQQWRQCIDPQEKTVTNEADPLRPCLDYFVFAQKLAFRLFALDSRQLGALFPKFNQPALAFRVNRSLVDGFRPGH